MRQHEGADPGAVLFDALQAAKARGVDVVLCDTAGRLHNKANLMAELAKLSKIIDRECPGAARETLLVLDATTGQNGLIQARQFKEAAGLTGIVLTKLDGTAKGGIVVAIAKELGVPVKLAGVGEGVDDLKPFDARRTMWRPLFERQRETRITIWNRRKLISVSSQQMYFLIRGALSDAGLSSGTRTRGLYAAAAPQQGTAPTAVQDSVLTYTIYVHRDDYDRAFAAIQSSLRGK